MTFRTYFYKAEKKSVLHEGVYTKEFAAMLFASAFCVVAFMLTASVTDEFVLARYIFILFLFIFLFYLSKKFVFREKCLEVIFDRAEAAIIIHHPGLILTRREIIPFGDLKAVEVGGTKFTPQNIDGIRFVEKISLQHGSAVPGLAEQEEFVTMSLKLKDDRERIIFAARIDGEPELPIARIKTFLEESGLQL